MCLREPKIFEKRRSSSSTPNSGNAPLAMNNCLKLVGRGCVLLFAVLGTACHGLLDVSDPTHIDDASVANASGANARRVGASLYLSQAMVSVVQDVSLFTDEWTYDVPAGYQNGSSDRALLLDQRDGILLQTFTGPDLHLGGLESPFVQAALAIPAVRSYTPDPLQGDYLAHLYALRGYILLQMAEDLCPGFPVNDVVDGNAVYSGPLSTDSVLTLAIGQLDTAMLYERDSTRFSTLTRVTKGRALLDQGKYTDAAAIVAPVLTTDVYNTELNARVFVFDGDVCPDCVNIAVSDREGVNGLPFGSMNDPRVPTHAFGPRITNPDDSLYSTTKGSASNDRIVLAGGVEARLIEAEAALHNGQDWKAILDALRSTVGLGPLVDPGTLDGRVDLLYNERAFWLFMTGRRLGDLRRLVKNYGRNPETVFPTGTYKGPTGSSYGTATSIPFVLSDQQLNNPHITTGCTSM